MVEFIISISVAVSVMLGIYYYVTEYSRGLVGYVFFIALAIIMDLYFTYMDIGDKLGTVLMVLLGVLIISLDLVYTRIMLEIKQSKEEL